MRITIDKNINLEEMTNLKEYISLISKSFSTIEDYIDGDLYNVLEEELDCEGGNYFNSQVVEIDGVLIEIIYRGEVGFYEDGNPYDITWNSVEVYKVKEIIKTIKTYIKI